jgi:hypothetical protein
MRTRATPALLAVAAAVALAAMLLTRPDPVSSQSILLEDDFDDGVIDPSIWSVEVARPGYGIWQLPELPPPFVQATEESGELRFAGSGYAFFDYARVLVTKNSFSGSSTLEIDLTSLSGSGGQWGAGVVIVKDDFTAIQVLQDAAHWSGEPSNYYAFTRIARESCIDGTPGCPTSPGGDGTPLIDYGEVKPASATSFPTKLYVVYNGATRFDLYWVTSGQVYSYTHNAPEAYDTYRIAVYGGTQLDSDNVDARFDNFTLVAGQHPPPTPTPGPAVCGNSVVEPPEQCDPPQANSTQCAQSSYCQGVYLCVRDAYGDCSGQCACSYDAGSCGCQVGQCGAQCATNDDCPSGWTCAGCVCVSGTPSPAVGGLAELPDVSGSSGPHYAALGGGLAAALLALTAGGWYARRRWLR